MTINDFDKIYCINCIDNIKRYYNVRNQFQYVNILDKIDFKNVIRYKDIQLSSPFNGNCLGFNKIKSDASYHVTMYHYELIKTSYLLGYDYIIIFEDDINFIKKKYFDKFMNNIPNDFDIILFDYMDIEQEHEPYDLTQFNNNILYQKTDKSYWKVAFYALSRKGMEYFFKYFEDYNYTCVADLPVGQRNDKNLNFYISTIPLTYSDDIENVGKNKYDFLFKNIDIKNTYYFFNEQYLNEKNEYDYHFCIDYVLPYIDFTQKEIQELYENITGEKYTNNNNLTYIDLTKLIKLIFKNLPFINKLYITCKDIQKLPNDTEILIQQMNGRIVRINESKFMPNNYITFSASCIEMFIWKIPGLSEHFIYSNDDMIICKQMSLTNFFINDKPISQLYIDNYPYSCLYNFFTANSTNLIYNKIKNNDNYQIRYRSQHSLRPLTKTICKQCFDKYKKQIMNSLTNIREYNNLNIDLYMLYGFKNKLIVNKNLTYEFKYIINNEKNIIDILNTDYNDLPDILCCNDAVNESTNIKQITTNMDQFLTNLLNE